MYMYVRDTFVTYYRKTRLHWQNDPPSEVAVGDVLPEPYGLGQDVPWHPTEASHRSKKYPVSTTWGRRAGPGHIALVDI